jgi:UDP-glucose 4-epimerase
MSSGESVPHRNVVVTGVAGRLGAVVARRLLAEANVHLIGIDRRPLVGLPEVEHHPIDLRSRKVRDVFHGRRIDAVIHLGIMHDPRARPAEVYSWNITGTSRLLGHCEAHHVPQVVLLSSANVYGPRPDNSQFLDENAPMLAAQRFPQIRHLVEIDHLVSTFLWKARDIETVILRPVHILGSVHNAPSNYLRLDPVPVLLGFDPMIQVIHEADVADAIALALRPGVRGIFNLVGPGPVPLSVILRILGRRSLPIPHPIASTLWSMAFKLGLSDYPVAEFDFIRYVCMVDGRLAQSQLGFVAGHSLEETVRAVGPPGRTRPMR